MHCTAHTGRARPRRCGAIITSRSNSSSSTSYYSGRQETLHVCDAGQLCLQHELLHVGCCLRCCTYLMLQATADTASPAGAACVPHAGSCAALQPHLMMASISAALISCLSSAAIKQGAPAPQQVCARAARSADGCGEGCSCTDMRPMVAAEGRRAAPQLQPCCCAPCAGKLCCPSLTLLLWLPVPLGCLFESDGRHLPHGKVD